jgi:EmrB/QacA subfamily drug resistance transporter
MTSVVDVDDGTGHPQRWLILVIVLLGQFMVVSAIGAINITLPDIQDDLGASDSAIQWVLVLYQLSFAVVLVTGGRLGDLYGRKRVFIIGLAGFVGASTLAAMAPTVEVLMVARLLQGVFGGVTSPQVLAVIQVAFPARERPRAFAAFGMVAGSAFMIGQVMSGALVELDPFSLGWRSPFVFNVVVGAIALAFAVKVLPETGVTHRHRLDVQGVLLASLGGLLLLYPLIQGRADGWPPQYFVMLALAVPVMALFVRLERRLTERGGEPLVNTRLFRARSYRSGLLVALAFSFSTFPTFYVLTLTLQLGFGFDPLEAALATAPTPIAVIGMSSLSARLLPRYGRRTMAAASMFGAAASVAIIVTLEVAAQPLSPLALVPALVLLGCNNGLGMTSIVNLTLADVEEEHAGAASGLLQTVQQATSAIGVALAGIVYFGTIGSEPTLDDYVRGLDAVLIVTVCTSAVVFALHFLLPPHIDHAVPIAADAEDDLVIAPTAPAR